MTPVKQKRPVWHHHAQSTVLCCQISSTKKRTGGRYLKQIKIKKEETPAALTRSEGWVHMKGVFLAHTWEVRPG